MVDSCLSDLHAINQTSQDLLLGCLATFIVCFKVDCFVCYFSHNTKIRCLRTCFKKCILLCVSGQSIKWPGRVGSWLPCHGEMPDEYSLGVYFGIDSKVYVRGYLMLPFYYCSCLNNLKMCIESVSILVFEPLRDNV